MSYKEVTSVSWFARLGSSFKGIVIGILLLIAGTALLWWNEGNFVATGDALNEAHAISSELGDITTLDPSKNGQLVHATGPVETKDMLTDPAFDFSVNAIRLERTVEFFQWVENSSSQKVKKTGGGEETVTTYSYKQEWVKLPVNSSQFHEPKARKLRKNFILANMENFKAQAENVSFGAYRLPTSLVNSISGAVPLNVDIPEKTQIALNRQLTIRLHQFLSENMKQAISDDDSQGEQESFHSAGAGTELADRAQERSSDVIDMIHFNGDTVIFGASPGAPQTGDIRVTFKETKPGIVSILAKVNGDTFEAYRAANGKTVNLLSMGTHSLENMYGDAHSSNSTMTWIWRFVGVSMVIVGLMTVVAPLAVVASVIPLLGSIVGAGTSLVAILLGSAWSLLIIAIAWLRFRPLMGGAMLAVAGVLIALLFIKGRSAKTQNPTDTVTKP